MTGWRLVWNFPKKSLNLLKNLQLIVIHISIPTQIAGIEALNSSQQSVNDMVKEFQDRRNFLVEQLNLIDGIECVKPGGAFYVFPKISINNKTSKEISNYLLEKKFVATVPGSSFGDNGEVFKNFLCQQNRKS